MDRRVELTVLTKSRSLGELAFEQGVLAGLTPLRDVAALGDNLTLVLIVVVVVFRASLDLPGWAIPPDYDRKHVRTTPVSRWSTAIWGAGSLYALYRAVGWGAGNGDLPLGGCLVVEAALVPIMMVICDGFLLAWVLTELRNAGLDIDRRGSARYPPGDRLDAGVCACVRPGLSIALRGDLRLAELRPTSRRGSMPRSLAPTCAGSSAGDLPIFKPSGLPWWVLPESSPGAGARSGDRLSDSEGFSPPTAATWSSSWPWRAAAAALLAGSVYAILLLLPSQNWVLGAADSYAHYVTLPVGLWVLAAVITLAERSLPSAAVHRSTGHSGSRIRSGRARGRPPRRSPAHAARCKSPVPNVPMTPVDINQSRSGIGSSRPHPLRQFLEIALRAAHRRSRGLSLLAAIKLGRQLDQQHRPPPAFAGEDAVAFPRAVIVHISLSVIGAKHPPGQQSYDRWPALRASGVTARAAGGAVGSAS